MLEAKQRKALAGLPAVRERFLALNRERLRRTLDSMLERQRDFLNMVALLFHVNHQTLPGFVSKQTPVGISDYSPGARVLETARKWAKSFDYKKRALPSYDIHSLFLMGSSGTVAYSQASDFDIWICHRHDLTPAQLAELRTKAQLIEQWAGSMDLEVHFFLVDAVAFKAGERADLSGESSGTAQHYLLLEEFYRTSLLLAGRYPLWWLVPPDGEANYETYLEDLRHKRFIKPNEGIDFGPVARVPAEEFFGAALWQLYKGIDSPFKSVLKLLLMEVYASEYPEIDLLCLRFKRAIYDGEIDLDTLDPYMMLYQKIEERLLKQGELERLELVRRCFYFKVNERLGQPDGRHVSWRRELLRQLVSQWHWEQPYLELLDARPGWKINRVLRERKFLVSELTGSYKFLSDFARQHARLAMINQRDITVLGRKLYGAFERKAGKVEILNRGISDSLAEERLSLHQVRGKDDQEAWELYLGVVSAAEQAQHVAVKRSASAVDVLAWAYLNGLIEAHTSIFLHVHDSDFTQREMLSIIAALQKKLPLPQVLEADIDDLAEPASLHSAAVFVDVGVDPLRQLSRRGQQITTARTDALSFSGLSENLALSFDLVLVTTWKEILVFHYVGVDGLLACVHDYFHWASTAARGEPPAPAAFCFSSTRGVAIAERIEQFFGDVTRCFLGENAATTARYVFAVAQHYYALQMENGELRHCSIGGHADLLRYLAQGQPVFSPVKFDRYALANTALPSICAINKPDVIQLAFHVEGQRADIWVLDERGALFQQRMEFFDRAALVDHFRLFFAAMLRRQEYRLRCDLSELEFECYEIHKDDGGKYRLSAWETKQRALRTTYFNVQVIAGEEADRSSFTVYCDDVEFTSLEHGSMLFRKVAEYILARRRSGQRYPIYITDIDLPRVIPGESSGGRAQTVHFLSYKKQIEQRLNEALAQFGNES